MSQKVWVIDDNNLRRPAVRKQPEIRDAAGRPETTSRRKSPVIAVCLDMLVWGSGHLYLRQYCRGATLMAAMAAFCSMVWYLVMVPDAVAGLATASGLPASLLLAWSVGPLSLLLITWLSSAVDAYGRAVETRGEPFRGVGFMLWPLLGSLVFPGWGQFLNGQPKKGLFFGLFGILGICSVLLVILAGRFWPFLHPGPDGAVFEIIFVGAFATLPLVLLMWIVAVHDAFWACREPVRKWPLRKRWHYFSERMRTHGAARALVPQIRSTALLGLLLAVTLLAGSLYVPGDFYLSALERARHGMTAGRLEIAPELITGVTDILGR